MGAVYKPAIANLQAAIDELQARKDSEVPKCFTEVNPNRKIKIDVAKVTKNEAKLK